MLRDHLRFLVCPHCGGSLTEGGCTLICPQRHTFDVARQGYVSLLGGKGRSVPGDTAEMVDARADFLAAGHFEPLAGAVTDAALAELAGGQRGTAATTDGDRCVVDVGAGTGYYLAHLAAALAGEHTGAVCGPPRRGSYGLVAVDVSKHAMIRVARLHPELAAVVADARSTIPVASGTAALVIDAFAPRAPAEIDRIVAPEGGVVVVVPRRDHLAELVEALRLITVDPRKRERADHAFADTFTLVDDRPVTYDVTLHRDDVRNLVRMGPSAWHQTPAQTEERLGALPDPVSVSVAVDVLIYRRGQGVAGSAP